MDMTKAAVKVALGCKTDAELARFYDTTRQAVDKWAEDEPIPRARQWELRARRPDLFEPLEPLPKVAANDSPDQAAGEVADAA